MNKINKIWGIEEILEENKNTLIKRIKAWDNLSIQVHAAKDEKFIALSDSVIYTLSLPKFKDATEWNKFRDKLVESMIPHHLEKGDIINVNRGMIHYIAKGSEIIEISSGVQETLRLYDWGRGRKLNLKSVYELSQTLGR